MGYWIGVAGYAVIVLMVSLLFIFALALIHPYELHFVYGVLPYVVKIEPPKYIDQAAVTHLFEVTIRPAYKNNTAMRMHEETHVKQNYRTLGMAYFIYAYSAQYRLKCEIEAYRAQIAASSNPDKCREFSIEALSGSDDNYDLHVSRDEIRKLLE
jgi:hypothetical protein